MPDQLYPDTEAAGTGEATAPTPPKPQDDKTESPEGKTALLPKTILGGKEFAPGDEVVLKVVKVYEDEIEVQPSGGEESEKAPEANSEASSPEMDAAQGQLESMATQ